MTEWLINWPTAYWSVDPSAFPSICLRFAHNFLDPRESPTRAESGRRRRCSAVKKRTRRTEWVYTVLISYDSAFWSEYDVSAEHLSARSKQRDNFRVSHVWVWDDALANAETVVCVWWWVRGERTTWKLLCGLSGSALVSICIYSSRHIYYSCRGKMMNCMANVFKRLSTLNVGVDFQQIMRNDKASWFKCVALES